MAGEEEAFTSARRKSWADLRAAGAPPTMEASYKRVKRDLREGRGARYHTIKHRNPPTAQVRPSSK